MTMSTHSVPIDPALLPPSPSSAAAAAAALTGDIDVSSTCRKRRSRRSVSSTFASEDGDEAYAPSSNGEEEEEGSVNPPGAEGGGAVSQAKDSAKVKGPKGGVGRGIPVGAVKDGTTRQAKRLKLAGVELGANGRRTTMSCALLFFSFLSLKARSADISRRR
jgi:hypothetical protein